MIKRNAPNLLCRIPRSWIGDHGHRYLLNEPNKTLSAFRFLTPKLTLQRSLVRGHSLHAAIKLDLVLTSSIDDQRRTRQGRPRFVGWPRSRHHARAIWIRRGIGPRF